MTLDELGSAAARCGAAVAVVALDHCPLAGVAAQLLQEDGGLAAGSGLGGEVADELHGILSFSVGAAPHPPARAPGGGVAVFFGDVHPAPPGMSRWGGGA